MRGTGYHWCRDAQRNARENGEKILQLRAQGMTIHNLAERFDVSTTLISAILESTRKKVSQAETHHGRTEPQS